MLSRTSEYALRAMVYLARQADRWPVSGTEIAAETGIPRKYLSSILSDLVRAGVLASSPGVGGGFAMVRLPRKVYLSAILEPFERLTGPGRACPFGNEICSDEVPCAGHEQWKRVREAYSQFLQNTTIYDVSVEQSRRAGTERKRSKRRKQ